jgi:hypothetical protein
MTSNGTSAFGVVADKKEMVLDHMSGSRIRFSTIHAALLLLTFSDRSLSAVY